MKTKLQFLAVFVIGAVAALFAQGPLTPPGAPAPTMKTLDQIESRTPISSATNIAQSGSYYLTTNITVSSGNAITITADNVTLDLNGFTVSSTEATPTGRGILLSGGRAHIHILNGHIKGSVTYSGGLYSGGGFAYGISYSGGSPRNVRVSGVSVSRCMQHGIDVQLDNSTIVESCTVHTVGGHGMVASSVSHSAAKECGMRGINADTASDSRGEATGSDRGVSATTAQNCYGSSGSGNGVTANNSQNCYGRSEGNGHGVSGSNAQNCYGFSGGSGNGVNVFYAAHNCYGQSVGGAGISASIAENCHGSSVTGRGMDTQTANNCYGYSNQREGLYALRGANNCYGECLTISEGIDTLGVANNCYGNSGSGNGVFAENANSCIGWTNSSTGVGLYAKRAMNCYGRNNGSGIGLSASVAFNCEGTGGTGGHGLRFTELGAMCSGFAAGAGSSYVLGAGQAGPVDLP